MTASWTGVEPPMSLNCRRSRALRHPVAVPTVAHARWLGLKHRRVLAELAIRSAENIRGVEVLSVQVPRCTPLRPSRSTPPQPVCPTPGRG